MVDKVVDMEEKNNRERRRRRIRKEVLGCVHDVMGKNKFLVQFKYG